MPVERAPAPHDDQPGRTDRSPYSKWPRPSPLFLAHTPTYHGRRTDEKRKAAAAAAIQCAFFAGSFGASNVFTVRAANRAGFPVHVRIRFGSRRATRESFGGGSVAVTRRARMVARGLAPATGPAASLDRARFDEAWPKARLRTWKVAIVIGNATKPSRARHGGRTS